MHPKHSILLKKNARRLTPDASVAFYYVDDKATDQHILHIDKKIRSPAKFANVKKVNKTLLAFDDEEYQVTPKARMCAGTVTRDDQGLVFTVEVSRKLGESQLARSLKKFKKLIGKAFIAKGGETVDVDETEEVTESVALPRIEAPLRAYSVSAAETNRLLDAWRADGRSAEDERYAQLLDRLGTEGELVDSAVESIDNYLASAGAAGTAEGETLATAVVGRPLSRWIEELDGWEQALIAQLGIAEEEPDVDLTAEIRAELREANLSAEQISDVEHAQAALSTWLLQQQEIFRRPDTQVDGLITGDEVFFTQGDQRVVIDEAKLAALGLDAAFTLDEAGMMVVRDDILTEDGISPEGRQIIASALINGVQAGYALHLRNPSSGSTASDLDLHLEGDDIAQQAHRQAKASATNLQFDRHDEIVPGSDPAVSFRDVLSGMNGAPDDETFTALNEMLHDAYLVEVSDGLVDDKMTFLQYKMQFVDLEVPNLLESGLHWHDGSGQLNAAEWAFTQLRVKDLPEKTQYNYKIEISSPHLVKKKFDKTMDLGIKPPAVPTEDDIYRALARDGFWAEYAGGKDLVSYYKGAAKITVKLGYADPDNDWALVWTPTSTPFYIGKVTGQDEVLPLVDEIPENALKTLTTDVDGSTRDPRTGAALDLTDTEAARAQTADAISKTVMKAALSSWSGNSGQALSNLLQPIPDSQKVFLRQSNGTVNAIRIGNGDLRNNLKDLASNPDLADAAAHLEELLAAQPLNEEAIERYCTEVKVYLNDWIEWSRTDVTDDDERAAHEASYDTLWDAVDNISKVGLTDIGQTEVITDGNDTGAFGKCAPTAYFCGAMCGISVRANEGMEALEAGTPAIKAEADTLRALITGQPMDPIRREEIDAQLEIISAMLDEERLSQRERINGEVQQTAAYTDTVAQARALLDALSTRQQADLASIQGDSSLSSQEKKQQAEALHKRALQEMQQIQNDQRLALEAMYRDANAVADKAAAEQRAALDKVKQLKRSTLDQLVVTEDEDGPYFDMSFPVPRAAMYKSGNRNGWLLSKYGDPLPNLAKTHPDTFYTDPETGQLSMKVKVRPGDIQEYLEETNREDKYRGNKKHMMDFFKDPSSMNNIQLMDNLGPGLIAVGLDKGLKDMGKDSGLLYGPGADTVASMVYREDKTTTYDSIRQEMPKKGTPAYEKEFKRRRKRMLNELALARDSNGSVAVSMGFKSANGHVNYIQSWGTPTIGGVEISSDDIARCRMNVVENAAGSSAWNNDRVQEFPINPSAMKRGITGIEQALRGNKETPPATILAARAVRGKAQAAEEMIDDIVNGVLVDWGIDDDIRDMEPAPSTMGQEKLLIARNQHMATFQAHSSELTKKYVAEGMSEEDAQKKASGEAWGALPENAKYIINAWNQVQKSPEYPAYLDALRAASADAMAFLKGNLTLDQSEASLNPDNVLIMPSNTERDNAVSDNTEDRERIGDGNIGSQKYGSANATDHTYFVPVNALASGWNGVVEGKWDNDNAECTANRYNHSDDPRDQFVMLASMTVMHDR
jgi:hypothetical protein